MNLSMRHFLGVATLAVVSLISHLPVSAQSSAVCTSTEIREAMQAVENQYVNDPNGRALTMMGSLLMGIRLDSTATAIDSKEGSDGGRYTSRDPGSFVCRGLFVRGNIKVQEFQGADSAAELSAAAISAITSAHPNFVEWFKVKPTGSGHYILSLLPSSLALAREYSTQFTYPDSRNADIGLPCTADYPKVVPHPYESQFGKTGSGGPSALKADQLLEAGRYDDSLAIYRQLAEGGSAMAMRRIGAFLELGHGVQVNPQLAMQWYRKASDAGDATAMVDIGRLYDRGNGVPRDFGTALSWYRKAADAGSTAGMINTGLMYSSGAGVPRDYAEALVWFRKAADAGDARAMNNLGAYYLLGTVVSQDYSKAIEWFRKASEGGVAQSMTDLGVLLEGGFGVRKSARKAACWYRKGADGGDPWGMTYLGALYNRGEGVMQDNQEALRLYSQAADLGQPTAMNNIGAVYENGLGVQRDVNTAIQWYRKAAALGDSTAKQNLARLGAQ